jgi:hypothetical protein
MALHNLSLTFKRILLCFSLPILVFVSLSATSFASSWYANRRSCEALSADAIFIGRVIKISPTEHLMANELWPGYSIRFAVEEVLKGKLGQEVTGEIGSGCGGCTGPPDPGKRFLVFAVKGEDGKLWTNFGSDYELHPNDPANYSIVDPVRKAITFGKGSLYGRVTFSEATRWDDKIGEGPKQGVPGIALHATSATETFSTRTAKDGTYEFKDLPNGRYTVTPEVEQNWTFDQHFFSDRYEKSIGDGSCANADFDMHPTTRLKGKVKTPPGEQFGTPLDGTVSLQDIVAVPTGLQNTNERSGIGATVYPDGQFDIWPIPAGDYYVGINITKSPTPEMSYEPTYYPGVTDKKAARVVHLEPGEVKYIELPVPKFAQERLVHIVAMGLDGKPLPKVRMQREDLQHPGDAINSTVDVDLDANGAGTMNVYAGITYHLHASYFVGYRHTWCAAPVLIPAGSEAVEARFVMNHDTSADDRSLMGDYDSCDLVAVDKASKDVDKHPSP